MFTKKVESGSVINVDTIRQELEEDIDEIDDTSGEINPYHDIIVNEPNPWGLSMPALQYNVLPHVPKVNKEQARM